jgi:polysaccharide export outer membrane protein
VSREVPGSSRPLFALLLCATSLACMTPAGNPGMPSLQAEYHIAPPDTLTVMVRPEPEISRTLVVRPDGRISFDLIGDVDVRGRTVEEVRQEIARRLKEFIVQPDVTVVLTKSESRTYYVFGEVARPGAYALLGEVTALGALGASGGDALRRSGRLATGATNRGDLVYGVHFEAMTQSGYGRTNYVLQPGDVSTCHRTALRGRIRAQGSSSPAANPRTGRNGGQRRSHRRVITSRPPRRDLSVQIPRRRGRLHSRLGFGAESGSPLAAAMRMPRIGCGGVARWSGVSASET